MMHDVDREHRLWQPCPRCRFMGFATPGSSSTETRRWDQSDEGERVQHHGISCRLAVTVTPGVGDQPVKERLRAVRSLSLAKDRNKQLALFRRGCECAERIDIARDGHLRRLLIAGMSRLPQLEVQVGFEDGTDVNWHVGGVHFDGAINDLYEAEFEIETEQLDIDLAELLGATCELTLRRGEHPPRPIYGVVARVDDLGRADHRACARATVVPAFAVARRRINTRIWQDRSVQDIVREVLDASLSEYGRSVELGHLRRGAAPRDYCVQYRESDYDFVCRLLEEEGITWYFVHDLERGHEVLTLCDDNEDYDTYANVDDDASLPIISHNPEDRRSSRRAWPQIIRLTNQSDHTSLNTSPRRPAWLTRSTKRSLT